MRRWLRPVVGPNVSNTVSMMERRVCDMFVSVVMLLTVIVARVAETTITGNFWIDLHGLCMVVLI